MKKYEVQFYNGVAQQTQREYLIAKNKKDCQRILFMKHHREHIDVEHIYEYTEPHFYTEHDITKIWGARDGEREI